MAAFDIMSVIDCIRQCAVEELQNLPACVELTPFPSRINVGDRLYEMNLRAILKHLKHVAQAYKRQGAMEAHEHVLAYRSVVKQLHDVNEFAKDMLLSIDVPGLNDHIATDVTPEQLGAFLNAFGTCSENESYDSPFTINKQSELPAVQSLTKQKGSRHNGSSKPTIDNTTAFQFTGNCLNSRDCPDNPGQFRFRVASNTMSSEVQCDKIATIPVSSAVEVNTQQCFLQITGETLEDFIEGVEVDKSKVDNKKRWLVLLQSLQTTFFLGRWPTPSRLKEFMRMHDLEWVVRVRGKWDTTRKVTTELKTSTEPLLDTTTCFEQCKEIAAQLEVIDSAVQSNDNPVADTLGCIGDTTHTPHPNISLTSFEIRQSDKVFMPAIMEEDSGVPKYESPHGNLNHVFVWQNVEDLSMDDVQKPLQGEQVAKPLLVELGGPYSKQVACDSEDAKKKKEKKEKNRTFTLLPQAAKPGNTMSLPRVSQTISATKALKHRAPIVGKAIAMIPPTITLTRPDASSISADLEKWKPALAFRPQYRESDLLAPLCQPWRRLDLEPVPCVSRGCNSLSCSKLRHERRVLAKLERHEKKRLAMEEAIKNEENSQQPAVPFDKATAATSHAHNETCTEEKEIKLDEMVVDSSDKPQVDAIPKDKKKKSEKKLPERVALKPDTFTPPKQACVEKVLTTEPIEMTSITKTADTTTSTIQAQAESVQNWSLLPIVAGVAIGALYMSARCPLLALFTLTLLKLSYKSR